MSAAKRVLLGLACWMVAASACSRGRRVPSTAAAQDADADSPFGPAMDVEFVEADESRRDASTLATDAQCPSLKNLPGSVLCLSRDELLATNEFPYVSDPKTKFDSDAGLVCPFQEELTWEGGSGEGACPQFPANCPPEPEIEVRTGSPRCCYAVEILCGI